MCDILRDGQQDLKEAQDLNCDDKLVLISGQLLLEINYIDP